MADRSPLILRTHYDNLHITRDAPPEVVRAAYQALASKLHPDRNPNNPQAETAMKLVNAAYEALSDPVKREQHDRWIRQMQVGAGAPETGRALVVTPAVAPTIESDEHGPVSVGPASLDPSLPARPSARAKPSRHGWAIVVGALVLGVALIGGAAWLMEAEAEGPVAASMQIQVAETTPTPSDPARQSDFVRPEKAPGGEPWPSTSGYVGGFKLLFNDGQSTVTLDNSANPSDVYVKLFAHRDARAFAVRWVFVKGKDAFVVRELRAGRYEVRYRDLDNGVIMRSEPFDLREGTVAEGTRFTVARIPLQKVAPKEGQGVFDPDF